MTTVATLLNCRARAREELLILRMLATERPLRSHEERGRSKVQSFLEEVEAKLMELAGPGVLLALPSIPGPSASGG